MAVAPLLALPGGVRIPQLGFGVAGASPADAGNAVRAAIETGYRAIDTDRANEAEVGAAIAASGVAREDVFVTTRAPAGRDAVVRAIEDSESALGHVDLCLLSGASAGDWRALTAMHAEGRIRAIGVAGLGLAELRRLIDETGTVPAVHQIELNPWQQQVPLREFHGRHGILTGAARPFGRGTPADETVTSLAAKYGKTPAQIVLRWHLQTGTLPVPKSLVPARIRENFAVFDFELADDDLTVLAELDTA